MNIGHLLSLQMVPHSSGTVIVNPPPTLELSVLAEGNIEITASGVVTIHLTAPAYVASYDDGHPNGPGWFERQSNLLENGPINLIPAQLSGPATIGSTLEVRPGVWLTCDAPTSQLVLESDISGSFVPTIYEGSGSYEIPLEQGGTALRLVEQVTDEHGTSTSIAGPINIEATNAVSMPQVGSIHAQEDDLVSGSTPSETTFGVFPSAGLYVVGLTDLTSGGLPDITLTGSAVTNVTLVDNTTGPGDTHVHAFLVSTSDASDLVITNASTTVHSLARNIYVLDAYGRTETGAISGTVTALDDGDNPLSVVLDTVPAGYGVAAFAVSRQGQADQANWSGDILTSSALGPRQSSNGQHLTAAASTVSLQSGDFTASVTFEDQPGAEQFAMVALALAGI